MPDITVSEDIDNFMQSADNAAARTSLGLGSVDNTADADKPVSTAQATAISSAISSAPFATTAQGALADSALQPEDDLTDLVSRDSTIATGASLINARAINATAVTDEFRRSVDFALPSNDMGPLVMTSTEYDDLTEYEPRIYNVLGVGRYFGSELILRDPWQYSGSDLHVAKTGDDGTGDGSFGNPYLTIAHAWDQVASGGGITIWVNEGTYAEDDGSGYFLKSDSYTAPLIVQAVPSHRVVFTASSGVYLMRFNGINSNVTFKGIEFAPIAATTTVLYANSTGGAINNFSFIECFFNDTLSTALLLDIRSDGVSSDFKFLRNTIVTNSKFNNQLAEMNGFVFSGNKYIGTHSTSSFVEIVDNCYGDLYFCNNSIVTNTAGSTVYGIKQRESTVLDGVGTLYINRNRIETTGRGISIGGGISGTVFALYASRNYIRAGGQGIVALKYIDGGTIELNDIRAGIGDAGANGHTGLGIPGDGTPVGVQNLTIQNNLIRSEGGHAFLISYGSSGQTVQDNVFDSSVGGDHSCVIKGASHTVTRNRIHGGISTAFYPKGCSALTATKNHISSSKGSASAFEFGEESSSATPDPINCTFTDNLFEVSAGNVFEITSNEISTGNTVDNNSYLVSGTGVWGTMFGSSVGSLTAVRASWLANYDQTLNDANSTDQ